MLGCRSTVGLPTLDRSIGVRIPAPQPDGHGEASNLSIFIISTALPLWLAGHIRLCCSHCSQETIGNGALCPQEAVRLSFPVLRRQRQNGHGVAIFLLLSSPGLLSPRLFFGVPPILFGLYCYWLSLGCWLTPLYRLSGCYSVSCHVQ